MDGEPTQPKDLKMYGLAMVFFVMRKFNFIDVIYVME